MNAKYFHVVLAIWIFTVVSVFAESYSTRPTASEMQQIIFLGTQCAKGVNERCWATQYATGPAYYVAPFTNNSCWYLDQNFMGTMASKIKSLVPYYLNPATVYNGTTNIAAFVVTGLWAQLAIGDHTNQFTKIFANPPIYGDSPWRIYAGNLDERYNVLNALAMRWLGDYAGTSFPVVIRTAEIYGLADTKTGGYANVYYGTQNLGLANLTHYNIEFDARNVYVQANYDMVSCGKNISIPGVPPGNFLILNLDSSSSTNTTVFSVEVTLAASPDVVRIWNCFLRDGSGAGYGDGSASYTMSSAEAEGILNRVYQDSAVFALFVTITFPFQYCQ